MSKPDYETHGYNCNKHLFVSCLLSSYLGQEQQQNNTVYIVLH